VTAPSPASRWPELPGTQNGRRWALLGSLAAALLFSGGAEAAEQPVQVGAAKSVSGLLLVSRADGTQQRAQAEETVPLYESTTFLIRSRPQRDSGIVRVLKMLIGELWVRAGPEPRPMEVETPTAIAAIRGTEFNMRVQEGGHSVLSVVTGNVQFGDLQRRFRVSVGAGMGSVGARGRPPTRPTRVDVRRATAWAQPLARVPVARPPLGPAKAHPPGPGRPPFKAPDPRTKVPHGGGMTGPAGKAPVHVAPRPPGTPPRKPHAPPAKPHPWKTLPPKAEPAESKTR
jgi:ferric-dicitrate binding protein FerR (iron transport regulator)